jgi:hypothetical protein
MKEQQQTLVNMVTNTKRQIILSTCWSCLIPIYPSSMSILCSVFEQLHETHAPKQDHEADEEHGTKKPVPKVLTLDDPEVEVVSSPFSGLAL